MQQEQAPISEVDATAYAFLLSSINPWPMPPSLKKRLQTAELNRMQLTNVTCSMSMTFFHSKSKRFYGSTWVGHEHPCMIRSPSTKIVLENFNELTYFFTRINDPCCFIVIELIMNILSPLDGSVSERLGCGWAVVNPFIGESMSNGSICLLGGSPRRLLELKGNRARILDQLAKNSTSELSFTIWRLEGLLSRALPLCIKENQIAGAHTSIAGLRSTRINHFDNRGSIVETCIGANTHGNILDWTLSPPLDKTSIFENPRSLKASNICVTLPQRNQIEKTLKSWMAHATPKDGKVSTLFGWKKAKFVKDVKETTSLTMQMQPKLSIGAHNGNTILRDQWHEVELCSLGDDVDPNRLYAKEDVEINSFVQHDACALLFKVEYLICVQTSTRLLSPTKTTTHQTTIVVGLALFFPPYDVPFEGRSAVMLNLENDARCQILCDNPIFFSRQEGPDSPKSFVKFELSAYNNTKTLVHDQIQNTANTTTTGSLHLKENDNDKNWENMPNDLSINEEELFSDDTDDTASSTVDISGGTSNESYDPGPGIETSPGTKARLPVEVADQNKCTSVTVTLRTFAPSLQRPESAFKVPNSLSFQLKFHAYEEIITNHTLKELKGIATFTHPASFSFNYDYSTADTAEELALYLMERDLYIEVFDSSKYLGTLTLPMHLFLRQGKDSKFLENLSVDIITPIPHHDSFHLGKPTIGCVAGSIILSIYCVGSETGITTPKIHGKPKRVIARSLLETSHSARSVVADLCQYDGQQRETDGIISHLPGQMLQAVEGLQRQRLKEEDNMMHDEGLDSFFRDITIKHGQGVVEPRVLKAIQWARESEKKSLISLHIMQPEENTFFIRPWVGQKVIATYSFSKQLPKGETFKVKASHPRVGVIPRTKRFPRMELAMYEQTEDFGEFDLEFDCMDIAPITVMVSLVSIRTRQVVEKFRIQVQPRLRVDHRFVLAGIENDYVRKTLIAEDTGDGRKASIRIVDKTSTCGITTNEKSSGPNDTDVDSTPKKNAVHIEFICPGKSEPFSERFYVMFSHDNFATLHESWEFIINIQPASLMPTRIGWKGVFDFSDS